MEEQASLLTLVKSAFKGKMSPNYSALFSEEHRTPADVSVLMSRLLTCSFSTSALKERSRLSVYDPAIGEGGVITETVKSLKQMGFNGDLEVFGEDTNSETCSVAKNRLEEVGIGFVDIHNGNSLVLDHYGEHKFDLISSCPPFGMSWRTYESSIVSEHNNYDQEGRYRIGLPKKSDSSMLFLLHMISKMKSVAEGGSKIGIQVNGNFFFGGNPGDGEDDIRKWLLENDLIETVIALPDSTLRLTAIPTYLLFITNNKDSNRKGKIQFIDATKHFVQMKATEGDKRKYILEDNISQILDAYHSFKNQGDSVILANKEIPTVDKNKGKSHRIRITAILAGREHEILYENLTSRGYQILSFSQKEIVTNISSFKGKPTKDDLSKKVYLRRNSLGMAQSPESIPDKAIDYIILDLNSEIIDPEYLRIFINSDYGKTILRPYLITITIPRISIQMLQHVKIAVPPLDEQRSICLQHRKISEIKNSLSEFETTLNSNLTGSPEVIDQIDQILGALNKMTEADEIRALLRKGETKTCEFKETFTLDTRKGTREKYIEKSSLKTIVAFLNTEGGTLLIGVEDIGKVTGIDFEVQKFFGGNSDKYLLHFKNCIKDKVGEEFYPSIQYNLFSIEGKTVLKVDCNESETECFFEDNEFYVRTNPSTDKLEGRKLLEYTKQRFNR